MVEFEYTIQASEGIHARPAGELVREAKKFTCKIWLKQKNQEADCKRILGIMGMGVKCGDMICVRCEGEDEKEAAQQLKQFFENHL